MCAEAAEAVTAAPSSSSSSPSSSSSSSSWWLRMAASSFWRQIMPQRLELLWLSHTYPMPPEKLAKGLNGFEELRKYMKQGSEFCREILAVIQERADLEQTYARTLLRLGVKLNKATSNNFGTLAAGWTAVALQMEGAAELHKSLGTSLHDEICKPLKVFIDEQNRGRRPVEQSVEKSLKSLLDRRADENRSKKTCFANAKDNEKTQDIVTQARSGKGKHTDKDITKLERKSKTSLDNLVKNDKDYIENCQKAESARQEWESSVTKGSTQMQTFEEDRIKTLQDYLSKYNAAMSKLGPKFTRSCDQMNEAVISVNLELDLRTIVSQRGTGSNQPEQILFDCCAEDMGFTMNTDRRKESLRTYLLLTEQALERERRGKEGAERLMNVYETRPNFGDKDAKDDIMQKVAQVTFTINLLEASHCKMSSVFAQVNGQSKPNNRFSQYTEHSKDKQGLPVSLLKLPLNLAMGNNGNSITPISMPANTQNPYPPANNQNFYEPIDNDPEFDSDPDDDQTTIGQCEALYEYRANQSDELSIRPGDRINIYNRDDHDWWRGEIRGRVGVFPATYVQVL